MAIIPEIYINAVTSIGIHTKDSIKWCGTGFFAIRIVDKDGNGRPFLVTNRHVFEGEDTIVLRLRKKDSEAFDTVDVNINENGKARYYVHPDDAIDIAVLPLNGVFCKEQLGLRCI